MKAVAVPHDIDKAVWHKSLEWIERLNTEENIEELWDEFQKWLAASPLHAQAYQRAEAARCDAEIYREVADKAGLDEKTLVSQLTSAPAPFVSVRMAVAIGFSTAATVGVAVVAANVYMDRLPWSYYAAPFGQVRTVTFDDQSILTLAGESAVRVHFSMFHRRVVLEHGQAWFAPRHAWLRPFDVTVNQHVVRATGTQFLVNRENEVESAALVAQGTVKVFSATRAAVAEPLKLVDAGEAVTIGPDGTHVEKVSPEQIKRRLAWRDGMLDFDETLAQAVVEFNQQNKRKLVIDDPSLATLPVTGRYDAHNPDLFAEDLKTTHHIEHTSMGAPGSKSGEIHLRPMTDWAEHHERDRARAAREVF